MEVFEPSAQLAQSLETNRAGHFTREQKVTVMIAGLGSLFGLFCLLLLTANLLLATSAGLRPTGIITIIVLVFYGLFALYLGLTCFFNARWFLPDAFGKNPVAQAKGKLEIKMPARDRAEMPYSYIVGGYSFAPYVVSPEVPLEKGRKYIVYYAAHSRMFLNIEPGE
jgi:hypothetical protein